MFYGQDRQQIRAFYFQVWEKMEIGAPMDPVEALIAEVIRQHPEYHTILQDPDRALDRDFPPEAGQSNPFLHMGMHIAVLEQIQSRRPVGINEVHTQLVQRLQDPHEAEHRMIDCLGEALWTAQRAGTPPDEGRYLESLRRLLAGS